MFSIFHTSFCGSTLLATLLSKSVPTLTEPKWPINCFFLKEDEIKKYLTSNFKNNTLIKFSSSMCFLSNKLNNKKIFIYRKLKNHLYKIENNYKTKEKYFKSSLNILHIMSHHQNIKNKILKNCSLLEAQAHFWVDRLLWILESENVYYLEYNDFILNKEKKLKEICNFFEITYNPVEIDYHVKDAGLNDNNEYIDLKNIKNHKKKLFWEKPFTSNNNIIEEIVDDIKKQFNNLESFI